MIAYGFCEINPDGEVIYEALPSLPKVKAHFSAMPYQEVRAALKSFHAFLAAKLCFQFLVLTAMHSGEARGAGRTRSTWKAEYGRYHRGR